MIYFIRWMKIYSMRLGLKKKKENNNKSTTRHVKGGDLSLFLQRYKWC